MLKKILVFTVLVIVSPCMMGQSEPVNNDTSYYVPLDDDFNLIIAASKGHLDNVRNLLSGGADINAVTVDNISALMYASENGDVEMVNLLLEKGADPNIKPYNGATALIGAAKLNHQAIAELLINYGANINARDEEGVTAIHYATAYNYPELVEMLLFYDADPTIPDKKGTPPVITAAFSNSLESLKILLNNGVDINSKDKEDFTPLMVAIQEDYDKIASYLIEQGADIDIVNEGGMTALAFAVETGDYDLSKELIERGADVNHRIRGSMNIISLARASEEDDIAEMLLAEGAIHTYLPAFNEFSAGAGMQFNGDDFFTSLKFSLNDSRYNTGIVAGFSFRPAAIRVFTDPLDDTLFQYWERRYLFYGGVEKRFALINPSTPQESGPFIGLHALYSFAGYRGSNSRPEAMLLFYPKAGWYVRSDWFSVRINYEYLNFNIQNISPHRFNVSFGFHFPLANKKLMEKEIYWMQYD